MKIFYSFIISCISILGYSQTILYQSENTSRTVQDPQTVVLAQGFHATSNVSNPFVAKIGPSTDNSGGGPIDSNAGANNPSGTTTSSSEQKFHDTKGNIEVNGAGQLQFTLPIALPPGVKSVAPQVNLIYSSGSGNGIAGYGWSLSGITAISRTGKNIEKDGEIKGIQLDYSDYYSFNGQRLILKSGEYGKDGAEYVTEKYSNVRIKSLGNKNGVPGPMLFHVTFEDGSQAWYGDTEHDDPEHYSAGRTSMEYNIVKWMDAQGNYITYEYEKNPYISSQPVMGGDVTKIKKIKWGGNETLNKSHFNEIIFNYNIERNLKELSYHQTYYYNQDKLLDEIIVKSNNNPFKRYAIEYVNNGTSYHFVNTVTEYNAAGESANPIKINYQLDQTGSEDTAYESSIATINTKKYADFDMDGITDYIEYNPNPGSSPSGPVGVIHFKNSVYKSSPNIPLQYDLSKFTSAEFDKAVPIIFKKNNFVKNSTGIVIPHKVSSANANKPDFEFLVYSIDIQNLKLNLEYSKKISYDQYSIVNGEFEWEGDNCHASDTEISEILSYDYNGDGISELILNFKKTVTCLGTGGPLDPEPLSDNDISSKVLIDSYNTEYSEAILNPENVNPDDPQHLPPGSTRTIRYSTIFFDLDENLAVDKSIYKFIEGTGSAKRLQFADFNGDGIHEIILPNNAQFTSVLNIKRDPLFNYSTINVGNFSGQDFSGSAYNGMLMGDFNGDAKTDILVPQADKSYNWDLYLSDGKKFLKSSVNNFIYYSAATEVLAQSTHHEFEAGGGCSYSDSRYFQYNTADLDADGKSEIIVTYVYVEDHEWSNHRDKERTVLRTAIYSVNKTTSDTNAGYAWKFIFPAGGDTNVGLLTSPISSTSPLSFYRVRDWRKEYLEKVIPFGTLSLNRSNQQIISIGRPVGCSGSIGCPYNYIQHYNYNFLPVISKIKSIEQGGIVSSVFYKDFNPDIDANFYKPLKKEQYPYYELDKIPSSSSVYQIRQTLENGKELIQDFRYRGAISHLQGKGIIGLRQTARSNFYALEFENTKIWSGVEIDPLNDAVPVKEWSIRTNDESKIFPADISENNTQLLSFKSTIYQTDKLLNGQVATTPVADADKPKIVTAIIPKNTLSKEFLTGTVTTGTITYGDYYLPTQSVTNVNNGYATTTSTFKYIHNPSGVGSAYYIGRPESKTDVAVAYGDTKSAKEEYIYDSNLLQSLKTWNRDNTGYLLETYTYDGFGNIIQKVAKNSIDSQIQTNSAVYDPKGRFVEKKTDNLGLETHIIYNDWGQIEKQTDPIGNTLINKYDRWGKLLSSKTNLEGTTTYQYIKDANANITIVQYSPNGDVSKKHTNKFGQEYKVSNKALAQGQFVSKETQYDVLGRKISESEPFFEGNSPTQWNTITYDDTVFPTRITTKSFNGKEVTTSVIGLTTTVKENNGNARTTTKTVDAIGNTVSSSDKGGTITFSYNAAGEQIQAKYAENIVTTKYDVWGRKSEFHDPSNGIYKYEYDGFGQAKKIISPKGTKEYTYNNLGQLISQKEISSADGGQATNKTISYSYDDKGRITAKSGTSKGKAYSSTIFYDPQARVLSSSESSNGKYYIQKGITYDDKARIISYEKQLYSSGVLTKVNIENVYSAWNGELYQVKDKNSGKILWEVNELNERGQVRKAKLGATNIENKYSDNGFLSEVKHGSAVKPNLLDIKYIFDALKNELKSRVTGGDFNISEFFDYDDNNRLVNWTNPVTGIKPMANRNTYDIKGRILENDQIGTIKFENPAKVYQPTGMTLNAAGTQNYNNDLIQSIAYNENNDPVFIDGEKGDVAFQYGLTSMRQRVSYGGNFDPDHEGKFTKFYSEDGSFEILKDNITGKEKHVLYIGGTPYESNIVYLKNFTETSGSYKFLHKDYLGSILAISDEAGNKLEQRHFDAWGNFTHLQIGNGAVITDKNIINSTALLLERGYTSHEHFAEVGIIHMNGRLYDPLLRRFLNADENIQDPYNTQNYNKYGYVLNNPLLYSDPTGEWLFESAFLSAVIIGAMVASFSYTIMVSITGQNWDLGKFFKATLFGAASAAVTYGIGSVFVTSAGTATQIAKELGKLGTIFVQGTAHALAQGTLSLMQGENFGSAFVSGFLGSLGASAFSSAAGKFANSTVGTIAFGAISGGVGAELTGGNFWQGAVIGGFVAGLNHGLHMIKTESPKDIIILNASDGAGGKGHSGVIIGNDKDGYIYMASDGRVDTSGSGWMGGKNDTDIKTFKTRQEAMDYAKTQYHYDDSITIKTTAKQDLGAATRAMRQLQSNYHGLFNNCNHIISAALSGAGLSQYGGYSVIPNSNFKELKNNFQKR